MTGEDLEQRQRVCTSVVVALCVAVAGAANSRCEKVENEMTNLRSEEKAQIKTPDESSVLFAAHYVAGCRHTLHTWYTNDASVGKQGRCCLQSILGEKGNAMKI